jgi:hypothetical protein
MAANLDVRSAVREANDVFWRWPLRLCVPLTICGTASWAAQEVSKAKPEALLIPALVGLFSMVMGFVTQWVQVAVSAMYLRARDGGVPRLGQVRESLGFPALGATLLSLFGWYLLWGLGFFAVAALPLYLWSKGVEQGVKGIQMAGYAVGLPLAAVFFSWVGSRYAFALPLVAMRRRRGENLVDLSMEASRGCRRTLMVVLLVGAIPGAVVYLLEHFVVEPHVASHSVAAGIDLVQTLLVACVSAWFTLLITQLTLQRISEPDMSSLDVVVHPPPPPLVGFAGLTD